MSPSRVKNKDEEISRDEAKILLDFITTTLKKPQPKGGLYYYLHRTPLDVAKEYKMSVEAVCRAMRRRLPEDV